LIRERLNTRKGHFMPPALLDSQFEALETPHNAIVIDITQSPVRIVEEIILQLNL
jgi:gluconate kinase